MVTHSEQPRAILDQRRELPAGVSESVAEIAIVSVPDRIWGFETTRFDFEIRNLGSDELADPSRHSVFATVDIHAEDGRFLRRASVREFPVGVPVGSTQRIEDHVDVRVFGGAYELRCGLHEVVEAAGATTVRSLPIASRPTPIAVRNTIFDAFCELVNACNFRCSFCPQGELQRPQHPMDFDLATKVVKDLAAMEHHHPIRCHLLGEPLLYKRFFDFVDMAHDHDQTIMLATNGSRFTPDNVDKIFTSRLDDLVISLNTPEESLYNDQRGTSMPYSEYVDGITRMVTALASRGGPPFTRINVLYDADRADNPDEVARVRRIANEWIQVARDGAGRDLPDAEESVHLEVHRTELVELFDGCEMQFNAYHAWGDGGAPKGEHFCSFPWRQLAILVDGQATACCIDSEGDIKLGNARFQTVEEIWNGPQMQRLREGFLRGEAVEPACSGCHVQHDKSEYFPG